MFFQSVSCLIDGMILKGHRAGVVCSSLVPSFSDQPDLDSLVSLDPLKVMSECEVPVAFTRGSRSRASLPVVRSANQTKDRSLGVLYLQYGDETKQIRMPNKISTVDTVQALFVSAFPLQLSMKMLESPSTAIYVKDVIRNMYYELSDVRSITDQSCLKVYHKEPAHAFSHAPQPVNGDNRIHKEGKYTSRDAPPLIRQTSNSSSNPNPTPHSVTALPSRIPFGPRLSGGGGAMPRERLGHPMATPSHSASPCPSAILERRDVKPDEDVSTNYHAAPSETLDQGYHRTSIRAYGISGMTMESTEHHSLFRQKSWKTPPSSPHRITNNQVSQCQGSLGLERSSPNRQSFRKEGSVDKGRKTMGSPVISDLQGHRPSVTTSEPQTRERMRAMEEQIASLTGLVQHALLKGPSINRGDWENASDRSMKSGSPVHSISSTGASFPVFGNISSVAPEDNFIPTSSISVSPLQLNLLQFRRNISGLRLQLQEMKHLQLQNQEWVCAQIKQVEQELNERLIEVLIQQEDPSQRQRAVVEEERCKYIIMEEAVLTQLGCATEELIISSEAVITPVVDDAEIVPPTDLYSTVNMLEPQRSSISSEVILSQPLTPDCAQSSFSPNPELPTKRTSAKRHIGICSSAQSEHTQPLNSSSGATPSVVHLNASSSSGASSLLIEEIISNSKGRNRAQSIESAEKEWEEKRQSMCHYDRYEFEKVLQEAEANMLRVIPSMDAAVESGIMPFPVAVPPFTRKEQIEKLKHFASTQEFKQTDRTSSEKTTKTRPEKVPKPQVEKLAKTATVLGKPMKPNLSIKTSLERPLKSQDKVTKTSHSSEKTNKSPPPPPPRRNYINSTGVITTRSGDNVYSSRKEGEIESPKPVPQQKPRNSPDLKPKPSPLPNTASAILQEEDKGNKIEAELQVFKKCLNKDIELKRMVEPQIKKLRSGALLSVKDKKNTEIQENKVLVMDENGNNTVRQNSGVIYYVTAQITKEPSKETTDHKAASRSPLSQVSQVNCYEKSQNKLLVSSDGLSDIPGHGPDNIWSLPSDLPNRPLTSSTMECGPSSPTQGKVHVVKVPQVLLSIEKTVVSPTAICTPVLLGGPKLIQSNVPTNHGELSSANQQVFILPKTGESKYAEVDQESETFLNPDMTGEEPPPPPPPDNIAFMITNTKVQALSTGEYQELVNAKKGNVQTVTVGSKPQSKHSSDNAENSIFSKKPVIIIFDEPMDIRLAYKRLSTIFECEEELERMLAEERIDEESEETEDEDKRKKEIQVAQDRDKSNFKTAQNGANPVLSPSLLYDEGIVNAPSDSKQDARKKFKFKFPKKQLAALTQAIRTGTKTGKKTLQVVVYEDEEESDSTIKQHKETKRFEMSCSKANNLKSESVAQESHGRTDEIRKSTYKTLDSLEQTIKQLETTISEMGPMSSNDMLPSESLINGSLGAEVLVKIPQKSLVDKTYNFSKYPSHQKKPKPHLLPRPAVITTTGESISRAPLKQNNGVGSPSSRMPVPMPGKTRQQQNTSDKERATKQIKLQDSHRQFRQANGSAKRSGEDPKSTPPLLPTSKIPAFPLVQERVSKSIRTIHTPSFTSYSRPHSGSSGKSAIPTATSTKDAS
ncbi:Sickle tail protein [Bagarius yarrelli]|uniref:Sickle tail protein n=1 Tax=Bagarius yarrelli TaxID=175774 RepID=A0A556VUE6_BAGYA|nr:Sickle tail protein [Bagarius yarrelli]